MHRAIKILQITPDLTDAYIKKTQKNMVNRSEEAEQAEEDWANI